jgi:hypothetical protein
VVYCYMDDLANWFKRLITSTAPMAASPSKIKGLPQSVK